MLIEDRAMDSVVISIIIPSYNSVRFIRETLESVFIQSYEMWECIIVDDGSQDNSLSIIQSYVVKDVRYQVIRRKKEPKGPSSCRNLGLGLAKGKYIVFLDSDDILHKDCLKNRIEFINEFKNYDLWIFPTHRFSSTESINSLYNVLPSEKDIERNFYLREFFNGHVPFTVMSPIWQRSDLLSIGGFDNSFLAYEDPELHTRYLLNNIEVITKKKVVFDSYYRRDQIKIKEFQNSKEKINLVMKSRFQYAVKYQKEIKESKGKFFINAFKDFICKFESTPYYYKFLFLGLKSGNISVHFAFKILLLSPYIILGITNLKGIGYFRIRNFVFK